LAVISFHSLEDRIVKRFILRHAKAPPANRRLPMVEDFVPVLRAIGDAQRAEADELASNPRARSAVLRVAEKLGMENGDLGIGESETGVRTGHRPPRGAGFSPFPTPHSPFPASAGGQA
jgi:16S rRNA (cytosine1402-N4)-methyltransferase